MKMMPSSLESRQKPLGPSPFEQRMSADELQELEAVVGSAMKLVRGNDSVPLDEIVDFESARAALHDAWAVVERALRGPGTDGGKKGDLFSLVERLRRLDVGIREGETRRRNEILREVGPALRRLQSVGTLPHLVALVPEVICDLGFDRAIMSSIIDAQWVTQASHVVGDKEWAAIITRAGQDEPAPLRGTGVPESEVVRRRTAVLVRDVQTGGHVHAPMAEASLSRSYVVAPIVVRSQVVGLVHGDRVFHRGDTDDFDRDTLAMFADGLSLAFERASLESRLGGIQSTLRQLAADAVTPAEISPIPSDPPAPTWSLVGASARSNSHATSLGALAGNLTKRELEVIQHLAHGETNAQIASRLVLSEDTVKTHVKHILRKVGASNRAEAVSKWLLAETRSQ
ncbi:MAG: LuxR C-terminal-related transcriptional regulator [Solirubrobacteraceae bacterium]